MGLYERWTQLYIDWKNAIIPLDSGKQISGPRQPWWRSRQYSKCRYSNGSIIVGNAPHPRNSLGFGAYRWTSAKGMGFLPSSLFFANAITPYGSMIVGGDDWLTSSGQTGIFGPFPGEPDQTQAFGVIGTVAAPVAVGTAIEGSDAFGATFHAFAVRPSVGCRISV